ncbi:hypothetical protein [Leptospira idonii]|uniref:Uncharacterized protein n=1 Tax=Leptospira idonii TaxID=1193500 RepID=A0A4R9LY61_9LEPT|nr:hypothetical protein [Leptospira idonii]TGN17381.1 hypothetical protein EHS15_17765 [Leptospira idonii]
MWKQTFNEEVNSSIRELPKQLQSNVLFSFFQKTSLGLGEELSWISLFPSPAHSFLDCFPSLPQDRLFQLTKAHVMSLFIHYLDDQIIDETSDSVVNFSLIHFRTIVWQRLMNYVNGWKDWIGERGIQNFHSAASDYLASVETKNHHFRTDLSFSEDLFLEQVAITIRLPFEVARQSMGQKDAEILWELMKGFGFAWRLFDDFFDEKDENFPDRDKYLLDEKGKIASRLPIPEQTSPLFSYYKDVLGFLKQV